LGALFTIESVDGLGAISELSAAAPGPALLTPTDAATTSRVAPITCPRLARPATSRNLAS